MTARSSLRWSTFGAGAIVIASALAACGGSPSPMPSVSPTPTVTFAGLPPGVSPDEHVPMSVPNDPALRAAVKVTDCARSDSGWTASGTAKNSGGDAVDYRVTVFFTSATATVLETADAVVSVAPNGSEEWKVEASFAAPDDTLCVLTGVAAE